MRTRRWIALAVVLSLGASASAQRVDPQIPDDFPRFTVPGHEREMTYLRELHWLHYRTGGPMATLWDEWMSWATQWQAVGTENRLEGMKQRWRDTLNGRVIDPEGYVATHQHASIAHQQGWPFPFWALGGGEGWGWHFSLEGTPGPVWTGGQTTRPADGWVVTGANSRGVEKEAWNLDLTAPMASVQPPPPITIGVQQAPFLQLRWRARGLAQAHPFVEWQQEGQGTFSDEQRMYFEPVDSDAMVFTMIPVHRHPKWTGRITALRVNLGNAAPGARVGIQALFTQYDTRHTVNNQNFIKGVAQTFWWTRDLSLLRAQINRTRLAMRWLMTDLGGRDEKMIVARFVGHDGRSGLVRDGDKKTLRPGHGIGSHYWDILPCGYRDAYATTLYYDALRALAKLEREIAAHPEWNVAGGALRFEPEELERHAADVKTTFQKTFWNPATKRFVLGIDADGKMYDYGYTFMNCEAMYYGLASEQQARDILDWLSGRRIVEGDTSTGADIYHYRFAPRASTRRNIDWYGWYWSAPESIPFGDQVQDGGAVLGFSYHDLMSRLAHNGPDDAWARLKEIATWFNETQEEGGYRKYYAKPGRGTMQGSGTPGGLGLDMEFFESLLVPQVMLRGFAGFEPTGDGFALSPRLPKDWPSLTIDRIAWHGLVLRLMVARDRIEIHKEGNAHHPCILQPPPGPWRLTRRDESHKTISTTLLKKDAPRVRLEWGTATVIDLTRP